jgi:hypothetical protein
MRLCEGNVFIFPIARLFFLTWMTLNLRVSSTWKQAQYLRLVYYNALQLSCYLVKLLSGLLFLTLYCNFINTLYNIMALYLCLIPLVWPYCMCLCTVSLWYICTCFELNKLFNKFLLKYDCLFVSTITFRSCWDTFIFSL